MVSDDSGRRLACGYAEGITGSAIAEPDTANAAGSTNATDSTSMAHTAERGRETDTMADKTGMTIGIVGLGLIGGSLARHLAANGYRVIAWNHRPHPYEQARRDGIVCVDSLEELAGHPGARPDLIVLCNPLKAMPQMLSRLAPVIDRTTTTLTDVGSVKALVRQQVVAAGLGDCYVGAHPMTGTERSGFEASDPSLFDHALWAITVDESTDYRRFHVVARMITEGCANRCIVIDDGTHDRAAALISHMPHVVATALINELTDNPDRNIAAALAAGSWRDMTRVALTDPQRTRAMVDEDAENVETLLRHMADRLVAVADALHDGDDRQIGEFFAHGQPFRDYKAACVRANTQAETPETMDMLLNLATWREQLLESARRGEQVTGWHSDAVAVVERRPAVASAALARA